MPKSKVITLWQPYASFIAWEVKKYETRSWQPRGLKKGDTLLIHAAKRKPSQYEQRLFRSSVFQKIWQDHNITTLDDLDYGVIICATKYIQAHSTNTFQPTAQEKLVGNYAPDRFAWELELVKVANPPIIAQGQQGIWYYEW